MPIRSFTLLLGLLLLVATATAQKSSNYLKRLEQTNRVLYSATPVAFKAKNPKVVFEADFTLNYSGQDSDRVVLHFSLLSKEPLKAVDSLVFSDASSGETVVRCAEPGQMFLERGKKNWHTRFETQLSQEAYLEVLALGDRFQAELFYPEGRKSRFTANKDWRRSSEIVYLILSNELR